MKRFTPSLVLVAIFSLFSSVHCGGDSTVDPAQADADRDGETIAQGDCDDNNPLVNSQRVEVPYDGVDQDCSGEDLTDVDGDGVEGLLAGGDDCDDQNADVSPRAKEIPYNNIDDDCDPTTVDEDVDGDGFAKQGGGDCDDDDANIHPGATEIPYDGVDQDCSGKDLTDVDRDGYDSTKVSGGTDCDDDNALVRPAGVEICGDDVDQDCSGADLACSEVDSDKDGYSPSQGDCDDKRADVNPDATEVPYNGRDDDCDLQTPDDDLDRDGFAKLGGGDCDDDAALTFPGANEIPYDGIDQDCSGDDLTDVDRDGYDDVQVSGGTDCDDLDPKVHPDRVEVPYDNVDQNCDGSDLVMDGVFQVLRPVGTNATAMDIAFNGSEHLLVYRTSVSGDPTPNQIIGQRLSAAGQPLGDPIEIFKAVTGQTNEPAVASDGTDYLVAFRTQRVMCSDGVDNDGDGAVDYPDDSDCASANDVTEGPTNQSLFHLWTQRVSQAGALVGPPVLVREYARVAMDLGLTFSKGNYALIWREYQVSPYGDLIQAQLIGGNGSLVGPMQTLSQRFSSKPAVGSNGASEILVTWTYNTQLFGQLLNPYGGLTGARVTVSNAANTQTNSAVAFDGQNFLVAWDDSRNTKLDIFGQRISEAGTRVGSGASVNAPISTALGVQKEPKLAYCGQRYTAVFRDERFYIAPALYRQSVGTDGVPQDAAADENILFYASGNPMSDILLSCGGGALLTLWQEAGIVYGILLDP